MLIDFRDQGSIFDCGASAVVIPVNCVGVAGKGVAKEARKRWPEWFKAYNEECMSRDIFAGDVWSWRIIGSTPWLVNAATKQHWRDPSTLLAVGTALARIRAWCRRTACDSIAIPALGCGLGGLDWSTVRLMIENLDNTDAHGGIELRTKVIAFAPQE